METNAAKWSFWTRFWHAPVRAERLGLTRILFGLCLLAEQMVQYLPNLSVFFGPEGVAPKGLHDAFVLSKWYWSILIFNTDNLIVVYTVFWIWVAVTVAFTLGWRTGIMKVLVWFLTMCFLFRNPALLIGADDTLMAGLFWLMLSPCGKALSMDYLRQRRKRGTDDAVVEPPLTAPWPVRLIQIQLCFIYLSTGLAKLRGETWWDGTSIHYALNYVTMTRWSYAQLQIPIQITAVMSYVCVWWEILFSLLVLHRWTRKWALLFGILFHLGIFFTIEIGWFSFYTLAFYGVWVSDRWWQWLDLRLKPREANLVEAKSAEEQLVQIESEAV